jgi:glutathione S-transferase
VYKVYGYGPQRHLKVTWLLNELGIVFQVEKANLVPRTAEHQEFRKLNPFGKVPVLQGEGLCIWESGAIFQYLVDLHRNTPMAPAAGTIERARHDQWVFFALTELEQPLWHLAKNKFVWPEHLRSDLHKQTYLHEWHVVAKVLESQIPETGFITGDPFQAADIKLAYVLNWANSLSLISDYPKIKNYLDRCLARPTCTLEPSVGGNK